MTMNKKNYLFYHIGSGAYTELLTRNLQHNKLNGTGYTLFDYNDTISLFLDRPRPSDIELLISHGFDSYIPPNKHLYFYEVDLEPYKDYIGKILLTSTPETHQFSKDNKHLTGDDFSKKKGLWMKQNNIQLVFKGLDEFLKVKNKYLGFSKYVRKQIQESKADPSLKEYYAACIPHIMLEIKIPIASIKIIDELKITV